MEGEFPNEMRDSLIFLLTCTLHKVNKFAESVGWPLKPRDMFVLLLAGSNSHSQQKIANILRINANSLVIILDRLEDAGWVTRKINPSNRRAQVVMPTKKGQELIHKWNASIDTFVYDAMRPLSRDRVDGFKKTMQDFLGI